MYVELADRAPISDLAATTREVGQALTEAGALSSPDGIVAEPKFIQYAYVVFDHNYYATRDILLS